MWADKPLWTKSIFSRTFPILQKLSKSSGYPGWRTTFQCFLVGNVGPEDEGHVGRIFRILCRKGAGAVKAGELVGSQWDAWDGFYEPAGKTVSHGRIEPPLWIAVGHVGRIWNFVCGK